MHPVPADHPKTTRQSTGLRRDDIAAVLQAYQALFDEAAGSDSTTRKRNYEQVANQFYDLVTDFYQFGWGDSFHFAARRQGERFKDSLIRCERFLADELELTPAKKAVDIGCGIGGPLCEIARYSGAGVVGVNNNAYQVRKVWQNIERAHLQDRCAAMKADFMSIPVESTSFDAAYAMQATPHAPDKTGVFREIYRILKPGGLLAGYEWCLTPLYDPENTAHQRLKLGVEVGNGLPDTATTREVEQALEAAGFEILVTRDMAADCDPETPWYRALQGRDLTLGSLPRTPLGRALTNGVTWLLEGVRLVPKGTQAISTLLNRAADDLVTSGELGIFTPLYYFKVRRPVDSRQTDGSTSARARLA